MRRRRGRKNPSTTTWLLIGGGVVLTGVGIYYLTRPSASPAPALPVAAASPGGSAIVYTDASGKTYTRDQAAQSACQLLRIGHPREAAFWSNLVTSNGGVLPC